jgi:hypothetical protein
MEALNMPTATHLPTTARLNPTEAQDALQHDSIYSDRAVQDLSSTSSSDSNLDLTSSSSNIAAPRRRSSVFFEEGLKGEDAIVDARMRRNSRPSLRVRFRSKVDVVEPAKNVEPWPDTPQQLEQVSPLFPTAPRIMFFVLLLAVLIPSLGNSPFLKAGITPIGAKAVPVKAPIEEQMRTLPAVHKRQNSDTDVCTRWSGQSAVVNGTMYYFGGRASTSAGQTSGTWSESCAQQPRLR